MDRLAPIAIAKCGPTCTLVSARKRGIPPCTRSQIDLTRPSGDVAIPSWWGSIPVQICSRTRLPGRGQGGDPASVADRYGIFCREVIDVVAPLVPAVKPQAAFFEELGPPGMVVLGDIVRYAAEEKGLLVILDGKRNDIGSTAAAYARGFLGREGQSPWGADAMTVSPYLGEDSLEPFVETAVERSAGVFVLVKTSNPGGGMFQDLVADGRPLYRHVARYVEKTARADRRRLWIRRRRRRGGGDLSRATRRAAGRHAARMAVGAGLRQPRRNRPRRGRGLRPARQRRDRQQFARHPLRPHAQALCRTIRALAGGKRPSKRRLAT